MNALREAQRSTPDGGYRQAEARAYPRCVPQTEPLKTCANCSRPVRVADAEALGWTSFAGDRGEPLRLCPLCTRLAPHVSSAQGA